MARWVQGGVKSLLLPGGALLLLAVFVVQTGWLPISAPAVDFYYYAVFAAGFLLAWRFHSGRILLVLATLVLAHRAVGFFADGRIVSAGPGRIAFEAVALLLPLNFIVLSAGRERRFAAAGTAPYLVLLLIESVFVAVIARPGAIESPALLRAAPFGPHLSQWTQIPQLALFAFGVASGVLLVRFVRYRKPTEGGLFWALAAAFAGLQSGAGGKVGNAYFATAGLILAASLVENSYLLAYHDELTSLPGRRAFNEAVLTMEAPFAVAAVDIDHFKLFNDTYGHDTGDQVLRLVASHLAQVAGGGRAYRVGGEEFSILFPGKSMKEVVPHLEALRVAIPESRFRLRVASERRSVPRGADRRAAKTGRGRSRRKAVDPRQSALPFMENAMAVTVSIGVAEGNTRMPDVDQVIRAADRALYRAKQSGRNRVETARSRTLRFKSNIA